MSPPYLLKKMHNNCVRDPNSVIRDTHPTMVLIIPLFLACTALPEEAESESAVIPRGIAGS